MALEITGDTAKKMARFDFIAHWLIAITKDKKNRGRLGLWVRRRGKQFQVVSPVAGGTVMYTTPDADKLFDFARRTELGSETRRADAFRGYAYEGV